MSINKLHYSEWHILLDITNQQRLVVAQVIDGPVIESRSHSTTDFPCIYRLVSGSLSERISKWESEGWIEIHTEPPLHFNVRELEPDPLGPSDYSPVFAWRIRPDRQSLGAVGDEAFVEYFRGMAEKFDASHCPLYGVMYERFTAAFRADFGIGHSILKWSDNGTLGSVSSNQHGQGTLNKYDTELLMLLLSINRLPGVNPDKPIVRLYSLLDRNPGEVGDELFSKDNFIDTRRGWTDDFEDVLAESGMFVGEVRRHAQSFGFKLKDFDLSGIKSNESSLYF